MPRSTAKDQRARFSFDPDLREVAIALCSEPTAPYHEHRIRAVLRGLLEDLPHVTLMEDCFGNLRAHYRHRPRHARGFALVAHMDHPGFVVAEARGTKRRALFLGGVAEARFPGKRVAFYRLDSPEPIAHAKIVSTAFTKTEKVVTFDADLPKGAFGMWDLPAYRFSAERFSARACDDLAGVIAVVTALHRLARTGAEAEMYALFTRAEEVGFHGALASLTTREQIPRMPVLSIETSKAQGFAKLGDGPVLRVGDRATIFHPAVTGWLQHGWAEFAETHKDAKYQRLLMGGGTCEGTVFQQAGYPTGALCLALHNFHNMTNSGNGIALEAVSLRDWQMLVDYLAFLATGASPFALPSGQLSPWLQTLQADALAKLT